MDITPSVNWRREACTSHHRSTGEEGRGKRQCLTVFLERKREGHRQTDKHWNCFKGSVWETSERQGGAHMGFPACIDIILNWTELWVLHVFLIIIMYVYHALINTLSAHILHINLNMIFYTHVKHSPTPTETIYIKYYIFFFKALQTRTHTHTHTHTQWLYSCVCRCVVQMHMQMRGCAYAFLSVDVCLAVALTCACVFVCFSWAVLVFHSGWWEASWLSVPVSPPSFCPLDQVFFIFHFCWPVFVVVVVLFFDLNEGFGWQKVKLLLCVHYSESQCS